MEKSLWDLLQIIISCYIASTDDLFVATENVTWVSYSFTCICWRCHVRQFHHIIICMDLPHRMFTLNNFTVQQRVVLDAVSREGCLVVAFTVETTPITWISMWTQSHLFCPQILLEQSQVVSNFTSATIDMITWTRRWNCPRINSIWSLVIAWLITYLISICKAQSS